MSKVIFIDRRDARYTIQDKTFINRQRFIKRYQAIIRQAVTSAINKRAITEIPSNEKITLSHHDLTEPIFSFGKGGDFEFILPGNKNFVPHDRIPLAREQIERQKGSNASSSGEGQDDFTFELSKDEFLDLFFDELSLPDLEKKELMELMSIKTVLAGQAHTGTPRNVDIIRSMRQATARRLVQASAKKFAIAEVEQQMQTFVGNQEQLNIRKKELQSSLEKIPFLDPLDLRYHYRVPRRIVTTQAVMFCLMDVSGSMDKTKKELAKRFFILLYLFLKSKYQKIDLVFIRHHTSAKEVHEDEFFYSRETGGTVVSSALELMNQIITKRYSQTEWNIYAAQASDGDNWNADSPRCQELLATQLLPLVQYYAYVEIMPRHHQSLWHAYEHLKAIFPHFAMQLITQTTDIYPVLRALFKKDEA